MENGWNFFHNSCNGGRGPNNNCSNIAWGLYDLGTNTSSTARIHWNNPTPNPNPPDGLFNHENTTTSRATADAATTSGDLEDSEVHALMFTHHSPTAAATGVSSTLYVGGGAHFYPHPDPHLMCLQLGKRHYFEAAPPQGDRQPVVGFPITKRGKPEYYTAGSGGGGVERSTSAGVTVATPPPAVVPRCQVEGCQAVLVNAKDYHRRHKVCEAHSKAPKVVVLGVEQRFCQQCSRFHAVSEFDDTKRSCRRRLAGHNERRRKSSHDISGPRNRSQENKTMAGRYPCVPLLNGGGALSLLSSKHESWISSADLPERCSAALRELIAENRAAILARQLILDKDWHWHNHQTDASNYGSHNPTTALLNFQQQMVSESQQSLKGVNEAGSHLTLDLMQAPSSAFGFLSMRGKSKEEEECSELWSSFEGAHLI